MPEAHEPRRVLPVLCPRQELLRTALLGSDGFQHLDDPLVGATVERPPQGADAGGDAGEQVGPGTAHQAHGAGGAVLFVVGMQNQQQVDGSGDDRINFVTFARRPEHHAQEKLLA